MRSPELTISLDTIDAAIFNLDGVVTKIAKVHAKAWRHVFNTYLRDCSARDGEDYRPFDIDHDYYRYVDGRPRCQAIKHFLLSRHIDLPMGDPDDSSDRETICGLGNRKNLIFDWYVSEGGVEVYGCAIALIRRLRKAGIKTAVVSASRHCDSILRRAEIEGLFDARIDAAEAERLDLDSKPDPDIYLEATSRLGVSPAKTVVFEDSIVGITAGKRGRFALVVGVDDREKEQKMQELGADFVIRDLCGVDMEGSDVSARLPSPKPLTDLALVSKQLAGKRPALFLDYGGTLAPIVDSPEAARLSDEMRTALGKVSRVIPVVVVSGRDLEEVSGLVRLPEIIYAGSHGLQIQGPDLHLEVPEGVEALSDLDRAARDLEMSLEAIPEVRLERKQFTIVVRFAGRDGKEPGFVESVVKDVQRRFPRLHLTGGKGVIELLPDVDWDKGRAVSWLLSELGLDDPQVLPIYIGDDVTDEAAFRAVRGRGLGLLVSDHPQPSSALYRLRDTDHVAALLRHLAET